MASTPFERESVNPSGKTVVSVDGHRITLTHLDKVLYPETGTTKAEVLDYYARVAEYLIPHTADRPLTRKRWVDGVGTVEKPGQVFFQKNLDASTPPWVRRRSIEHKTRTSDYPLLNDRATLTWLAQMSSLELHVPQWRFGRTGVRRHPDRLVLDLDPGDGAGLSQCVEVAKAARAILLDMGLDPIPVTSGSKGIHLYAALDGAQDSDAVSAVAHELAQALEADHPDLVVSDMKKRLRDGKVLVDWSQNNGSKTTIAPYSLRGRSRPTVAAPRTWRELLSPSLAQLEFSEVLSRLAKRGDPLAGIETAHLAALEPTRHHQERFDATPAARDRLELYRSKRDAAKTPEPVPAGDADVDAPGRTGALTFVIQEHHARRLHWDFRLEHDGVLVSWALPRGVPTDKKKNHLAVQTEDHPLEYGTFEGTIPAGEYGGGEVTIWDAGTIEIEKWRDDKEVIVTVHGEKHGTNRYALIHTGGHVRGGSDAAAKNNWLIHLMDPAAPAVDGEAPTDWKPPLARSRTIVGSPRKKQQAYPPMLATLGSVDDILGVAGDRAGAGADVSTGAAAGADWAFEMKWDGIRAVATIADGVLTLVTRNANDVTATYPDLAGLVDQVGDDAVVDGEIVAFDAGGRPDFGRLQQRMNLTKAADIARAADDVPAAFLAFDLLALGGRSLVKERYRRRRELLVATVSESDVIRVPPAFDGDLEAAIESSRRLGLEGVMAKTLDGTYSVGRRSRQWIKLKHHLTQEVVVVGWRPGRGRRAGSVGSLLLAVPDDDGLRYVGRVGTGFRDRDLDVITRRLAPLHRKTSPAHDVPATDAADAHWVTPRLVAEVEFAEWTATSRLRQPSWRGWRDDKEPHDVVVELP
ncbi:MAG: hypothetical protein RI885_830 [Actinomycetota bacterium]|jgi:bifunctional non-homologous end joining protein LigD